jgi:hypothetical protein
VQNKSKGPSQRLKKCPFCFTYLAIDAETCTACRKRVGEKMDRFGFAKKSVDWSSYIRALSMWIILGLYLAIMDLIISPAFSA